MRPCDAFDICHEVYVNARQVLDKQGGLAAQNPDASSKYLWRPDVKPKLGEFVADFALAGRRRIPRGAQADGHQRAYLGTVGRRDPRPRRARAAAGEAVPAGEVFS